VLSRNDQYVEAEDLEVKLYNKSTHSDADPRRTRGKLDMTFLSLRASGQSSLRSAHYTCRRSWPLQHRAALSRRLFSASRTANTPLAQSGLGQSSVNSEEIAFFSRLSSLWWDESGEYAQLHRMNPKRVEFVKEKLLEAAREDQGEAIAARMESGGKPLAGMDILDVGCGGGLLSEVCEL
jgi:hypothetical protein